jgi:hypothetical protein
MNAFRTIPAGILAAASAVLAGASKLAELGARRLAPAATIERRDMAPEPTPARDLGAAVEDVGDDFPGAGADLAVDADLVTDADFGSDAALAATAATLPPQPDETAITADLPSAGQARTYESHIAELADQNVSAVVRGIQDLSTEELGQLFDYESAHRKRRTVLQAIERAAAPPPEEQTAPPSDEQTVTSTPE